MFSALIISCLVLTIAGLPVENNDAKSLKNVNAELLGGGFEGDILFPPDFDISRGVGINGKIRRWPNRVIPYDISAISNTDERTLITNAMNQLMFDVGTAIANQTSRQTCVFFRPAQSTDKEVLKIQYGTGCSASVGYGEGYQKTLNLKQKGCFYTGIIQHELTHVLGFFHEQSRPDRDSFITIHHENVDENLRHNFNIYKWGTDVENQGFGYDYGSIMHYPRDAFSTNGKPTISTKEANKVIGQREKLSETDIKEIRHYYGC